MNDVLLKRLVGAAALLTSAFLLSLFLPRLDRVTPPEPGLTVLDVAVNDPAPIAVPAPAQADAPAPLPALEPETDPAAEGSIEPRPLAGAERLPESETAPRRDAEARPRPEPKPKPRPQQPAPPRSAPAGPVTQRQAATATAPPAQAPAAGPLYVLAGSYSAIGNARQVEAQLRSLRLPVLIVPVEVNGATLYRVRSGPFDSRAAADQVVTKLAGAGVASRVVQDDR